LVATGHKVTVVGLVSPKDVGERDDKGVRVIGIAASQLPGIGIELNARKLRKLVEQIHQAFPIDILEANELGLAAFPRSFPIKKVIRFHGGHHFFSTMLGEKTKPLRAWLENWSFRHADAFCAVSQFTADKTRQLMNIADAISITVIPNPVDVNLFSSQTNVKSISGRIVFVGTLTQKKGVYELIDAIPLILKAVPHVHLQMIGRDTLDPKTGKSVMGLLTTRLSAEAQSHIEFLGVQPHDQIPRLLTAAEVVVYPSHMETQGIAIIEGMSVGKAVVASRLVPGPEIIEDGVSGLLCDPRKPSEIASALILLLQDQALRTRLGKAARERAVSHFSLTPIMERNLIFYRELVELSSRGK